MYDARHTAGVLPRERDTSLTARLFARVRVQRTEAVPGRQRADAITQTARADRPADLRIEAVVVLGLFPPLRVLVALVAKVELVEVNAVHFRAGFRV